MLILLFPAILSGVIAAFWAGSLAGLRQLRIEWWPLGAAALAVKALIQDPPINQQAWDLVWGPPIWIVCLVAIFAMLLRNALRPGAARIGWQLAALGIGLNLLVVVANGGFMPQSPSARIAVKGTTLPADTNVTWLSNVTAMSPDSRLGLLGDNFAQPTWLPMANVVSVGDLILSFGIASLAFLTIGRRSAQVRGIPADS
jgi:Family of unknown function (DUF5317)